MITFEATQRLFHLRNEYLSCVLWIRKDEYGRDELLTVYLGAPVDDPAATLALLPKNEGASFDSLRQMLPYTCPTQGRGDYRPALVAARDASGQRCTELFVVSHEITAGKPALKDLPASYVETDAEADTLNVTLQDPLTGLQVICSYTLYRERPVLTSSLRVMNVSDTALTLERAGSVCLSLQGRWDTIHLHGGWAKERNVERVPAARMTRSISSSRGASGHDHNPFMALVSPETTETSGECVGVMLVWSGDHLFAVDENAYGTTRLIAGLNPDTFEWRLDPGADLQLPEAVCVYAKNGLNSMSQAFHALIRERVCRGYWRDRERPVLINNWEATYFNFNHEKLMKIARTAADLGAELFVLDDGWFGKRNDDTTSLGDWVTNLEKLPGGMKKLSEDIHGLGLMFGLWFEPEMISPVSDLYRAHPDWCLHVEGRERTTARHQLILDFSRTDVQDYIISTVSGILETAGIDYVKWDMNRNFKETGSALLKDGREGEISTRYMLGVYRVMREITDRFPKVLFEGCSGGGGRFDAGILYFMPQIWTSDNSDAIQRLYIQHGTSYAYPTSAMGAHVSAVPNHQNGRVTPMTTRGDVALGGNFGYELDLSAQTDEDKEIIRDQIARMKKLRKTTRSGVFTRLMSPYTDNVTAWQFADDERVILCAYRVLSRPNEVQPVIRLRNLPGEIYRDENGREISTRDLEHIGVRPEFRREDFTSVVRVWEKVR